MVSSTLLFALAVASSTVGFEHTNLVVDDHVSSRSLTLLPNTLGLSTTFEQVAGPVVMLVEESGGFADADPEKIAIYGDSWTWTRWYIDGFDVSDPLFDGAAAFHVPYAAIGGLSLRFDENARHTTRQGVAITSRRTTAAGALVHIGEAGGRSPLALELMDVFSGKHSVERTPPPTEERRRYGPSFRLFLVEDVELESGRLAIATQVDRLERRYLDFRWDGALNEIIPETTTRGSALLRYTPSHRRYETIFLAEVLARDRFFAEAGFQPRESSRLDRLSALGGVAFDGGRIGLALARYGLRANDRTFTRDLVDPDGESLSPFEPDGDTVAAKLDFAFEEGPLYAVGSNRALIFTPTIDRWQQPVTFRGEAYGAWAFDTRETTQFIGDHRVGAKGVADGVVGAAYDLFLTGIYAANDSAQNTLAFVDVGMKVSLFLPPIGAVHPFVAIAKTPMPIPVQTARTLDPAYLAARLTLADGRTIDDVGGRFVSTDDRLSGPNVYRAALGLDVRVSEHFRFGAQGLFKLYRGLFELNYDGEDARYGRFVDGVFYRNEREKKYILENDEDSPLYFGLHLDAATQGYEDFFFSASFSAYNAIGETTFGNGPTANDIAIVSAAGANPNADVLGLAAVDADRAFILKLAIAYRLFDTLWLSATIRHRDGQPFAFLDANEDDGQVAFTYHSNRGSPLQYQRPLAGPREDFHLGADVQLAYTLTTGDQDVRLWILGANLFDMQNEIHEVNGPPGVDGRAALESQLPRSLHFGVTIQPSGGTSR